MGARVCDLAHRDPAFALVSAVSRAGSPREGEHAAPPSFKGDAPRIGPFPGMNADVVIDFTSEAGALEALRIAREAHANLLVGATALGAATLDALRAASAERAVLVAPNTSLGIALAAKILAQMTAALGADYEIALVEAHHSAKKDAPSGTAIRLADAVRASGGALRDDQILSIRGGDVVGEHTVRFAGPGEYLELTHRATSRDVFARGALRAAAWLRGRAPGWWTMEDVLALPAQ